MKQLKTLTTLICLVFLASPVLAQFPGCPDVSAGADVTLDCTTPCTNLTASPFTVGATTSYTAQSIPHNPPIPYNQAGGTGVSVNTDDTWSPAITLPFTFCFFGQSYTNCTIGSNGSIKFGGGNANGYQSYSFTASVPSSSLSSVGDIFGIYHDIDPTISGGSVKYYLLGSAPCRIFVVAFNNLGHYSCTSKRSTFMMVLYETTNAIDVYVQQKETCTGWNSGNAVIGIQNPNNSSIGYAAPGRNTGAWTVSSPEGWRFLPSGTSICTVDWLQNGTVVGTGNTLNVCPVNPTTDYVARATYTACNGTTIIKTDTVTVNKTSNGLVVTETNNIPASCGLSNGESTITATGGTGPYTYSSDNVTFGSNNTFSNLAPGTYTFYAKDASNCVSGTNVTITVAGGLTCQIDSIINVTCYGGSTGEVFASGTGGSLPYTFTMAGGASNTDGHFTGLPAGNTVVTLTDAGGCSVSDSVVLLQSTPLILTTTNVVNATCGQNNGAITVSAAGGITPYSYTVNAGTTTQTTGTFLNLAPNSYLVQVTDAGGCTDTNNVTISADPIPVLSIQTFQDVSCNGANNGSVSLSVSGGNAPFTFTVDGGSGQSGSVFSNLDGGAHTFVVTDEDGCTSTVNQTLTEPAAIQVTDFDSTICVNRTITLGTVITGGTAPYSYSWNTGTTASQISITPTTSGVYTLTITDDNGCTATASYTITTVPEPIAAGVPSVTIGNSPLTVSFANTSLNATDYNWNFNNGQTITINSEDTVSSTFTVVGTYTVVLTAYNDYCENSWSTQINVVPYDPLEYELPNVFTPNGDANNANYTITTKNAKSIKGVIVDRWGLPMFIIEDLNFAWDGTYNGKDASEGVYFINVTITDKNDKEVDASSFFQLIRK